MSPDPVTPAGSTGLFGVAGLAVETHHVNQTDILSIREYGIQWEHLSQRLYPRS